MTKEKPFLYFLNTNLENVPRGIKIDLNKESSIKLWHYFWVTSKLPIYIYSLAGVYRVCIFFRREIHIFTAIVRTSVLPHFFHCFCFFCYCSPSHSTYSNCFSNLHSVGFKMCFCLTVFSVKDLFARYGCE